MQLRAWHVAVVIATLTLGGSARAQSSAPTPPADDSSARVAFLREALARDESPSRTWFIAWTTTYAAVTAAEATLSVTVSDPGLREDSGVGAVKSAIGFAALLVIPPPSLRRPGFLAPDATPEERRAWSDLEAEHLRDAANMERLGRSWLAHAGVIAVNLAGGAYLWLKDNRVASGILSAVSGTAVGEIQIFTQPTHAICDEQTWRATFAPTVMKDGAGVALSVRF